MPPRARLLLILAPLLFSALALAGPPRSDQPPAAAASQRTPDQVYRAACASCHGEDGRGVSRSFRGFQTPVPDFTECEFSTREPDEDWVAVVTDGGPARRFDKSMPAFGDALSQAEIAASLEHLRGFCAEQRSWPRGNLNLPRPMLTEKAFPEDELVLTSGIAVQGPGSVASKLVFEKRLGARGQVEVILPFTVREQEQAGWTAGLGDLALGTKWALLHSLRTGSILSLAGEVIFPTGNEQRGLGKGVWILEPFLSFGQLLPADAFFQFQGGFELSTEPDRVQHEAFWRAVLGISFSPFRFGRSFSPMIELIGFRELDEEAATHHDLLPQLQVSLSRRQHILASAGVRIPLDHREDRKPQLMFYLLWDWFDGALLEGW